MIQTLLLQVSNACAFGGLNTNNWIGISGLVILLSLSVAGLVYLISNFLGRRETEKLRGYVRFELGQIVVSSLIIVVLLAFAATTCSIGTQISQPPLPPFTAAQNYVGNLLFVQGIRLETSLYSTSIQFAIYGDTLDAISGPALTAVQGAAQGAIQGIISKLNLPSLPAGIGVDVGFTNPNFGTIFSNYAAVLTDIYIPLIILSFAMLFVQFILLPLISAGALTVVVPVALIMRSLSFSGPRLRETANAFLAIAIAFYFIFPMTFVMDQLILNWMYSVPSPLLCSDVSNLATCNFNPYPQYISNYQTTSLSPSTLFQGSGTMPGFSLPYDFYYTAGSQLFGSITSSTNNPFAAILYAPDTVVALGTQVSNYVFESTVLIALDLAITVGIAVGLVKGLNSAFSFLGAESIFS
ncbi:MAG: hypothetical protein ACREBF_01505 [Candidatus Micrarchaeales archaeon]